MHFILGVCVYTFQTELNRTTLAKHFDILNSKVCVCEKESNIIKVEITNTKKPMN